MVDRLNPLDVSFLYIEEPTTAMHVGGLCIFAPPPDKPFDYDRLVEIISDRIGSIPRYRQKVKWVPGNLASPVWVDDQDFDVTYHVRRSALPKPGNIDQLRDLVARLQSRQLDRARPLWEMYLVEGLSDGRIAIITKTHHAMVDGVSAIDIGALILDLTPEVRETERTDWTPHPEPSGLSLVAGAVTDLVRSPATVVDNVRNTVTDARANAGKILAAVGGIAAVARGGQAPSSPLNAPIGIARRYGTAATDLDDYKRIRKTHGGTVNDVVLATVSGALRTWMQTRGENVGRSSNVRAMVPVSTRTTDEKGSHGNRVSSYFVDLPVGEPSAVMRLHQVSYAMGGLKESSQSVGAESLVRMSGFAPPAVHSMGARLVSTVSRRLFNVVVTNVPGPQFPLYANGAEMLEVYPVVPLAKGQVVTIGLTSYNGGVYYGLNADRDAMPDVDVLASCIEESLAELLDSAR